MQGPIFPPEGYVGRMYKALQEVRFDYLWMAGNAPQDFGYNELDLSATFAAPFFAPDQPILVTPGLTMYFLSNPDTADGGPPRLYDAYLDTAWNPVLTCWLAAELGFRIGVYSDFNHVIDDSIRFTSRGVAVLALSPSFQIKLGVLYLDRILIKVLPAGGVVWKPNQDVEFDLLFPNPRIAQRLATVGATDWWVYLRGEYGGDDWTLDGHWGPGGAFDPGPTQRMDYNDIRVALGLDFRRPGGLHGLFEVGCL